MRSDPVADAVSALAALDGQRVWSLLVSVFGDLACGKGEAIDGPVLSAIMAALDIRPEATRVALHRLRNDGWLTSEKLGRTSRHYLTDHGLEQSAAASPRIYGSPDQTRKEWVFVIFPCLPFRLHAVSNILFSGCIRPLGQCIKVQF